MREDSFFTPNQEHNWVLKTLRRVQCHQNNVILVIEIIGIRDQCNLFEELFHLGVFRSRTNEFFNVFKTPSGFDRIFILQLIEIATVIHGDLNQSGGTIGHCHMHHVDERDERGNAFACGTAHARFTSPTHCINKRNAFGCSKCIELANTRVTDSTLRHIQHTLNADLIKWVYASLEIRNRIFDFTTIVKLGATHNLVRDAVAHERFFHCTALRIGAIHDGDIAPRATIFFL